MIIIKQFTICTRYATTVILREFATEGSLLRHYSGILRRWKTINGSE
jgi:hypothetical protein